MNVLLDGMFYSGHGFAEGNRILLRILDRAGYKVRIRARDADQRSLVMPAKEIRYLSSFERTCLPSNDLYICNWVGPLVRHHPDFRVNIVRTTFESDRIPESWVSELNKFNEVWVQCAFNRATFALSGVTAPIRQIPNFFDTDRYVPEGERLLLPVLQTYRFLSVFDMQRRKGYDLLIRAYLNEFTAQDDVALILKIRESAGVPLLEAEADAHPKPRDERPAIYIIDQMMPERELLSLYRACDAYVLPTRGEGWGRPFFEAMLMEKPVLGTDWSGQTEFMNERNAYPVKVEKIVHIQDHENPMFNGHYWAEPSVADLQSKMRHVFRHREEAKRKGRRARRELLDKYAADKVAGQVLMELDKYREGEPFT